MDRVRIVLVVLASLIASEVMAAPAPFTKPNRHPPSPEALLLQLRAEGFSLQSIERGPQSGTYVVTKHVELVGLHEMACAYVIRKWTVRTDVPDVCDEVRAILKAAPQKVKYQPWSTGAQPPRQQRGLRTK
jgi:hypothetical protein